MNKAVVRRTVDIPVGTYERLAEVAALRGKPMAVLIREALEAYLDHKGAGK